MGRGALAFFAALACCPSAWAQKAATASKYFKIIGESSGYITGGDHFEYFIALRVQRPLPAGVVLVAELDDPTDLSRPIVIEQKPKPGASKIYFKAGPFTCVTTPHDYRMAIRMYAGKDRRAVMDELVYKMDVHYNSAALREMGLRRC